MPESVAAVASYFTAGSATAGTAAGAGSIGAGAAGAATATAAASGSTLLGTLGTAAATAAGTAVVGGLLSPKTPGLPKPTEMPDPVAQEAARKKSLIEQISRRGRASTILTDDGGGKLGG